jgi:hypothetical protein
MNGRCLNIHSLLNFFSCSLRFLSFIRSQDPIANGALVIARLQLATGIRPVGRKAHNEFPQSHILATSFRFAIGAAPQPVTVRARSRRIVRTIPWMSRPRQYADNAESVTVTVTALPRRPGRSAAFKFEKQTKTR